ncbi:hypothetical protein D9613_006916 [Agrocybe pediades]|uniref:alpha-1,2-Mannosidase n=1 Tax=Agrocybe pediades TaxID=84607 RepID=A0A8H4VK28_9AGAR|nr:hypothetical protein D9613_006916 [Agrocybe pediades]KAF9563923.1 seven-hairpin glycosidase [Agrocybe pediades]
MVRRMPHNLVITIPPASPSSRQPAPSTTSWRSGGGRRGFLRLFPWIVGCTIVLWIFVLRADRPPLRDFTALPHRPIDGHKPRPYHPPYKGAGLSPTATWAERAKTVRSSFLHALNGYQTRADGYDELLPTSGGRTNNLDGWSLTLVDSLDTMWIMGNRDMFRESIGKIVAIDYLLPKEEYSRFYEVVSHHLGGLLSAYALSGEPVLLTRADDLAKLLLPAFNTTSGLPAVGINTSSGALSMMGQESVSWANILSNQMEFKYLAHITGRVEYFNKTENVMRKMFETTTPTGMFPTMWDLDKGVPLNAHYSAGEKSHSALHYLLKQWVMTARTDRRSLDLYLKSISYIINNLLYITRKRQLLYVTDIIDGELTHRLEHLSCSLPGLLALGVHTLGISLPLRERELHLWAAQGLAYTCWVTYTDQSSGLGPEEVQMEAWLDEEGEPMGRWMSHFEEWEKSGKKGNGPPGTKQSEETVPAVTEREYVPLKPWYLLRPELVESFYMLWKSTKNSIWRDRGWTIFEAIERHTKTEYGYAGILQVDQTPTPMKDEMPSYFLAETLKYLYLLCHNDDLIPLNGWVFNSKGHPLPVFEWSSWEIKRHGMAL